ncbi:MAG: asparagine synthase (glutamine-hydrolyzing) [Bacteriovoracaceae bacterium]|jgi:asparagine synthase (glutamine-hydrolysing)
MCGILAVFGASQVQPTLEKALRASKKISHRGPDESGHIVSSSGAILCHERLSIVDLKTGKQPIKSEDESYLVHNGEIYNHKELRASLSREYKRQGHSDSEVILHGYLDKGVSIVKELDGVFAFIISHKDKILVARDPIGVKPLFFGADQEGALWFASEAKSLEDICETVESFPVGHYYTKEEGFVRYYAPKWWTGEEKPTKDASKIRELLTKACTKRLMSDVPVGVLLSGGLDSSLVSSIVARELKKQGRTVKSFSIGLNKDSKDLVKAREVADFLGTEHHEITYTVEEGIAYMKELIEKVETYDVTTIRASTPMYIMTKYIREQGVKVVLSGEGADEMFGGYLYFGNAPTSSEFHEESVRRVKRLHTSDVQRADRSTMGAGVEARVPFLDLEFLDEVMSLDPELKVIRPGEKMEKHVLRKAFDTPDDPYLPDTILWRQKEQFSDGVGYSWVDSLKEFAEECVSDIEFAKREKLFPHNTPLTKEAFLYRKIYASIFKNKSMVKLVKRWIPRWQDYDIDPSGRANAAHSQTYHGSGVASKKAERDEMEALEGDLLEVAL